MKKTISDFKNIHLNKRCVIIGNGPSLNKLDLTKIKNEITFGCNRIYLQNLICPKYYAVEDRLDVKQFSSEINNYNCPEYKFFPLNYQNELKGDNVIYIKFGKSIGDYKFISKKSKYFVWGATVTYLLIQLAYWMGCNPIYLIGLDHDWGNKYDYGNGKIITSSSDDKYHFNKSYYDSGKLWALPDKYTMEYYYTVAKERLESEGIEIKNATPNSKLEIFEKVDYDEIF